MSVFNILIDNLDMRKKNESAQSRKPAGGIMNPEEDQNIMLKLHCLENGIQKWVKILYQKYCSLLVFSYKLSSLSVRTSTEKNLGVLLKNMDFTITYCLIVKKKYLI